MIRGMPADLRPVAYEEWEALGRQCKCMFSGLRDVKVNEDAEVGLGNGFSLVKPNEYLLSARDKHSMTGRELSDGVGVSRYLVYRHEPPAPGATYEEIKGIFYSGLLALQVLKPFQTLGITFYGVYTFGGGFSLQGIERRPPMEPGPWALKRAFDQELLKSAPSTIESIQRIMRSSSAERRNAVILLQLGLEHFHPLIAGLLWVMGLEAIFDSADRHDFKRKLCDCLGPSTKVFSDWKTVDEIAIPLYTLRSKLAHGVDLRKAASDPKYPVDLIEKHTLPNSSEQVPYALLLSEVACYLLCQVLQKEIAQPLI
jgi:hypothetical protein